MPAPTQAPHIAAPVATMNVFSYIGTLTDFDAKVGGSDQASQNFMCVVYRSLKRKLRVAVGACHRPSGD